MVPLITFLCLLLATSIKQVQLISVEDEQRIQVAEMLGEVSAMMLEKENIRKPPMTDALTPLLGSQTVLLEDDMILNVRQAKMILDNLKSEMAGNDNNATTDPPRISKRISRTANKWTFPIKYAFDGTHSDREKTIIRQAIGFWESATCVRFREYSSKSQIANTYSIYFNRGSGCNSIVGRSDSPQSQKISLGEGCDVNGIAAHEIGHALGMFHEHMRADRDAYLRINLANVISGYEFAFAKVSSSEDNNYGCPYDFSSVMHYDSLGFSSDYWGKKRVMVPKDPLYLTSLGQRDFVSFLDAKRVNFHYNCIASSCGSTKLTQQCQNGGYQDPNNCVKCRCPPGYGGDFCQNFTPASGAKCGGTITLQACSAAIITSPNYPGAYPAKSSCAWSIEAPSGSSLIFGFESKPDMPCSEGDTCDDYIEIRANKDPTFPGPKFCKCGLSAGRVVGVDRNKAILWFKSYSSSGSKGFRLNVYATCSGTKAATLSKECIISKTGYDYVGTRASTADGKSCAVWSGQNSYNGYDFPGGTLSAAGSLCRNPDSRTSPWCYVGSRSTSYCATIPQCPTGIDTTPEAPEYYDYDETTPKAKKTTSTTLKPRPPVSSPDKCQTEDGRDYIGKVSQTKSGKPCQKWSKQYPHKHEFDQDDMFPDGSVKKAGAFCRNPDPDFTEGVWCFTQDPFVERELCDVPACGGKRDDTKRLWNFLNRYLKSRQDNDDNDGEEGELFERSE